MCPSQVTRFPLFGGNDLLHLESTRDSCRFHCVRYDVSICPLEGKGSRENNMHATNYVKALAKVQVL